MALIKRKQLDLAIKSASAAGVSGGVYGTTNLGSIASGVYAISTGDQYEIVIDKIVGAIDTVAASTASAYYTYTANGSGGVNINLGGTVDFAGTANQITVSKTNTGSTAVNYAFALPSAVTMPGSLAVTTTLAVTGATTLTGALDLNSTANISGNVTLDGTGAQTITHTGATGNLTISSTNGSVLVEGTTFTSNNVSVAGNIDVTGTTSLTGNVTLAGNSQTVTHSGTGNLTIVSTNGSVLVEGITHTGNNISVPGTSTLTGNVTLDGASQTITHSGTGNLTISSTSGSVLVESSTFTGNDMTLPGNLTMSSNTATITHSGTGNLTVTSTNGGVVVEGITLSSNNLTVPGTAAITGTTTMTGNVTLNGNSQTITHTGTGNLTLSSTSGSVLVEGTTFTGNDVTIAGNLSVVGTVTQTAVNDLTVADRFIKLANGNDGSVTLTGLYQQTGTTSYAGLVYSSTENMFRLFTTATEPTTGTTPSSLTAATLDFGAFGANALEALQDQVNAMIAVTGGITKSYNDTTGVLTIGTSGTIANSITLTARSAYDGQTANVTWNAGTGQLQFGETDTAFVRANAGNTALEVVVRGEVQEDTTYNATAAIGKFTLDAFANAIVKLSLPISADNFVDNSVNNKEFVQVFVNGVKCRWKEFAFTAGSDTVTIYSGNGTVPPTQTGIGFDLESTDIITVLYYADQDNDTL